MPDFDPARDACPNSELEELDRWMLQRTADLVLAVRGVLRGFRFPPRLSRPARFLRGGSERVLFRRSQGPAVHLRAAQPRAALGADGHLSHRQRAGALAAPILAFTAEEIWKYLPRRAGEPDSVHLALFPKPAECRAFPDEALDARWDEACSNVRNAVLKALEQARNAKRIYGGLEARVDLAADGTLAELLREYAAWLPALFIVSQVELVDRARGRCGSLRSAAGLGRSPCVRADGKKCERCWNYSTHVGENADYPTVCERCVAALRRDRARRPASGTACGS